MSQDYYYYDSFCYSDCYDCLDINCDSHPENDWQWSPEAYVAKFCPYSGFGAFNVGDERCEFECALRKACEEAAREYASHEPKNS